MHPPPLLRADTAHPLGARLAYYGDFFALFGDFDTDVRFFLLDDLITQERDAVRSLVTGEPLTGLPKIMSTRRAETGV